MAAALTGFPGVISAVTSPIGLVALALLIVGSLAIPMTNGLDGQKRAGIFLVILACLVVALFVLRPLERESEAVAQPSKAVEIDKPDRTGVPVAAGGLKVASGKPVAIAVADPTLPGPDGYILPGSADDPIDPAALAGFSARKLKLARNEIYARHGMKFTSPDARAYFASKSWYSPSADTVALSQIEQANVITIQHAEADRG